MNQLLSTIYAVYFFALAIIYLPIGFAVSVVSPLFDPNKKFLSVITAFFMHRMCMVSPGWKLSFEGLENLEGGPYIMVANHQSLADIVVLSALPCHFKWVAKSSIFHVPFFGWAMTLNDHVPIKHGDFKSMRRMLKACGHWLSQGVSMLMFPEGTRSWDGNVAQFRDGPFVIAKQQNVPILPIVCEGTHPLLPKGKLLLDFNGPIVVRVLPPIMPDQFENVKDLREHARTLIVQELDLIRQSQPLPAGVGTLCVVE